MVRLRPIRMLLLPIDMRCYEEIQQKDMQTFIQLQPQLDALMPAHVIYSQVDPNPAGFSEFWIQKSVTSRTRL